MNSKAVTVSVLSLLASPAAQADDMGVFELGHIEVTAEALPAAGSAEAVVDSDSLRLHNADTVAEGASLVPGVVLDEVGARNEQTLMVRGFDLRQVPVFMDGIPVYVPYDGYVDLGRFTTFDLAELRVAKGFSSVLYGANTLGGAVNLVSRRPSRTLEGEVGAGWVRGEEGGASGYETYFNAGTNQGRWYAQAGGSYLDRDAWALSDDFDSTAAEDGGKRENSYRTDRKLSLKLGFTPNSTDEYAIGVVDQHGKKGNPPYAGEDPGTSVRYWQWPYWDKRSFYFLSQTGLATGGYIKTRVYYDIFKNALYSYDDDTYTTQTRGYAFKSYYNDYSYGASAEFGHPFGERNMLRLALHWKDDVHREHDEGEPRQRYEDRTFSVAAEDTHRFGDSTRLVAGVSYDQRQAVEAQDYDGSAISDLPTDTTHAWNPQIGLFHTLAQAGELRLTVSRKTRFATIKDRYSYRFGRTIPNPDLKPERATHYEIGYAAGLGSRAHLDVALFQADVEDLMQFVRVGDIDNDGEIEEQMRNIGKVRNRGVEVSLLVYPVDSVEAGASYSYLDRKNRSDPDIALTDTPEHKFFVWLDWRFAPAWNLTASARHESERISTSDGLFGTGDFTVADLKVGFELRNALRLEAGTRNLFDENYAYDEGYPEAGREWFVNANYRF